MTNFNYEKESTRTGTDIYTGTFEATTKPSKSELLNKLDRNNFGGFVVYCVATKNPNEYEFKAEVYRD